MGREGKQAILQTSTSTRIIIAKDPTEWLIQWSTFRGDGAERQASYLQNLQIIEYNNY